MIEYANKPDWTDAPDWAMWLAMDRDGDWFWWKCRPSCSNDLFDYWMPNDGELAFKVAFITDHRMNLGYWKETLEARP